MKKIRFKSKGSMILECVLAMFVLCIGFILFFNMVKVDNNSFKIRNNMRRDSIVFSNIINEIKFNVNMQELEEKLKGDKIKIGINNDISKRLKTDDVLNITNTDEKKKIEIIKIKNVEDGILLNFRLVENDKDIILEKEVKKESWMEGENVKGDIH